MIVRRPGALALVLVALSAAVSAAEEPREWLARTERAMAQLEYEGVFVYVHEGRVEAMQVTRTLPPQGPREHLVSLTGERREVVREGDEVRVSLPGGGTTLTSSIKPRLFQIDPASLLQPDGPYRFAVAGEDRVAGYPAIVIDAMPQDEDRYGYRLWLERETGMLVGSALVAPTGVIEQLLFTSLTLRPRDPAATAPAAPAATDPPAQQPVFRAPGLPRGFRLVAAVTPREARRQFVYSDGLASVSVYVEPLLASDSGVRGLTRRGAMSLFGRTEDGRQVVVVGDVPPATAERIAVALDTSAEPR